MRIGLFLKYDREVVKWFENREIPDLWGRVDRYDDFVSSGCDHIFLLCKPVNNVLDERRHFVYCIGTAKYRVVVSDKIRDYRKKSRTFRNLKKNIQNWIQEKMFRVRRQN